MKNNSGNVPTFAWPFLLLLAAASILMLSISEPEVATVEVPLPPQLYSSSFQLLATGNRLGTYYPAGHILTDWFNSHMKDGADVFRAIETNGSVDNLSLLRDGKVSLAMIESRIIKEAWNVGHSSSLRLVWPLWPDVIQLVKAPGGANKDLSELKAGFFGQKNSSTFRTSKEIFSALKLEPVEINLSADRVLSELAAGRIDFAMIQAGVPNRTVSDALIFHDCSLTSFPAEMRNSFLPNVSTAWEFSLPAGYYGEKQPKVDTFSIPNVLVAREDADKETIELLCELLSQAAVALKIRHQAFADVPQSPMEARHIMTEIGVPLHQGTIEWLNRRSAAATDSGEIK